ncbi:MAG: sodium:proton antiporter, partial [Bacteroidetes bacterium]|nr:sodium:proton antiporter [Bacteroidota bacterium]
MNIPSYTLIPFVLQLLVIAVAPLTIPLWWERNRNKLLVSLVLSIP